MVLKGIGRMWATQFSFIEGYPELNSLAEPLRGFVLWVAYNNGDEVKGEFKTKGAAINFLLRLK